MAKRDSRETSIKLEPQLSVVVDVYLFLLDVLPLRYYVVHIVDIPELGNFFLSLILDLPCQVTLLTPAIICGRWGHPSSIGLVLQTIQAENPVFAELITLRMLYRHGRPLTRI